MEGADHITKAKNFAKNRRHECHNSHAEDGDMHEGLVQRGALCGK